MFPWTIQKDASHHGIINPGDTLPGTEEPTVQQVDQALEASALVGGLSLSPVPGLCLAERCILLGYLSLQPPGLSS